MDLGRMSADHLQPSELQSDELELDAQAVATLVEKLKGAGHQVHAGKTGDFLVTRWSMSRHCQDSESLRDFARQLGVRS